MSFISVCLMFRAGLGTGQAPVWALQIKLARFGVGSWYHLALLVRRYYMKLLVQSWLRDKYKGVHIEIKVINYASYNEDP